MILIEKDKAIDAIGEVHPLDYNARSTKARIEQLPTIEIVRCKDCKWWEKQEDSPLGYCNAVKHCHYSRHWEIQIYRRYEADFFCKDGKRRSENEET